MHFDILCRGAIIRRAGLISFFAIASLLTVACSGGSSGSSSSQTKIQPTDFALAAPYSVPTCTAGQYASFYVQINAAANYSGNLTFDLITPTDKLFANETHTVAPGFTNIWFTVYSRDTVTPGTYDLTIKATDASGLHHELPVRFKVLSASAPNFSIYSALTPVVRPIGVYWTCTSALAQPLNGYNGTITLTQVGAPDGFRVVQSTHNLGGTTGTYVPFDLFVSTTVAPGTYHLVIKVDDGNITQFLYQTVQVNP